MTLVKIVLDAGHGYNTIGKRTPEGVREWSFNNRVAEYCDDRLKQYGKFQTMRVDDTSGKTDIPLKSRTDKANKWKADVYCSIHQNANAGVWGSHGGTEVFYYSTNTKGKKLAQLVLNELVGALKLRNRGIKTGNHLHVVRETTMLAILSEGFFMDSTTDKIATSDEMLKKQGYAIADGIAKYFGFVLPNNQEVKGTSINKGDGLTMTQYNELKKEIEELKKELAKKAYVNVEGTVADTSHKEGWEWGKENGLTVGTNPRGALSRQQFFTVLYAFYKKYIKK